MFSNQIETSVKIIDAFKSVSWVVLQSLMQSGKTGTYFLTSFEMVRYAIIDHIWVLCGSSAIKLKKQVQKDFEKCLDEYLEMMEDEGMNRDDRKNLKNKIKDNIKIYFSNDLKNINNIPNNILIIWDESHYAQDIKNRPNMLFEKLNIEATGNKEYLETRNIFVLSVSATGFSEYSDIYHLNQDKKIVKMIAGDKYIGVKEFYGHGRIITFKSETDKLEEILTKKEYKNKYSVVRCTEKNIQQVSDKYKEYGWTVKIFNSNVKEIESLDCLRDEPENNTVILIKGMCRMGEQLCKNHIAFVMETSKQPKTDVVLQGLLGRMCGYDSNTDIEIYLNESVLKKDKKNKLNEFEKFLKFYEGEDIMPGKGNNLVKNDNIWMHNIICKLPKSNDFDENEIYDYIENNIHRLENFNSETYNIENRIVHAVKNYKNTKVTIRYINSVNKTYSRVPEQINKSFEMKKPALLTDAGCTFTSNDEQIDMINIWIVGTDEYKHLGLKKNDIYFDTRTKNDENVCKTTKLECFSHKLIQEDKTVVEMNGVHSNFLPPATSTNENLMKERLLECVKLSLDESYPSYNSKSITSAKGEDNKWVGILVSQEIYDSLQKNGNIYNEVFKLYKLKIKTHKQPGKQKLCESKIKLTKISW